MEKDKTKKRLLPFVIAVPIILIVTLGIALWASYVKGRAVEAVAGYISLKQRDIAIGIGETAELEIAEVEAAFDLADAEVKWISNNPTVAPVDKNGIVTGEAGGEARITVVVRNARKEYTASCIVTVKAEGLEYSSYQIHWYTQRQDRNGYEVLVETYERLVGSEVNLTKKDAREKLPGHYVLNKDKCVLSGVVKENKAGCVLKVYYDVAEISYAVDFYYESDTALGTYKLKETKQYKAYAFSTVNAPTEIAKGFVIDEEAKGSVLTANSVTSSTRLKVYCERIRSKVTIKYASERQKKFKAVIRDDVFSFWIEDNLVWKLPLTDPRFGGFKAGTYYRFALRCLDNGGQAEWSNLAVKYGDGENAGKYKFKVDVKTNGMTVDTLNGKITANLKDDNVHALFFATDNASASSKSWEITGTFKQLESLMKGFTIQKWDKSKAAFYTMYTSGVSLNQNYGYPVAGGWNIYPTDGKYVFANTDYEILCKKNNKRATYENIYGIGLVGAPADALEENLAPYETSAYISGKQVEDVQSAVKELTADAKVEFRVAGRGFTYQKDGSLLEDYYDIAKSAYANLEGSGKTIYLSANYNLTGSATNMSGITLRSGDENRQILFNHQGVVVLKNYEWQAGTVSNKPFEFNHGDWLGYVLVQNNSALYGTKINSVISNMITDTESSSHDVVWAVWEGTLYCSVDGIVVLRLPLNQLVKSWTADTELEIGFAAYDGAKVADEFMLRDVEVKYDSDAESMLYTDGKVTEASEIYKQAYDPLSGTYIPASENGASWIYGTKTKENSGITADVTWMDKDNTGTMIGATIRMGDASVQYYVRGQNTLYHTQNNHKWDNVRVLDIERINAGTPFNEDGTCKIGAYVKDGYFYVTYNGVQAHCINILSLFSDYTKNSEVSVGICTMDANAGSVYIDNTEILDENDVAEQQSLKEWHLYSEAIYGGPTIDFAEGTIVKDKAGFHEATLLGSSKVWHIKGVMKRTDAKNAGDLLMGFVIGTSDKTMSLYGHQKGFVYNWKYSYNGGANPYAFGNSHGQFFNSTRNKDELPFEMIIYEDILYVYLDGELSWRIPLTEEQFGFGKGSLYKVKLSMADPDRKGAIEDIEVRMGYQVTEETEFTTYKGKSYSFKEAMSKIEANAEANEKKWQDMRDVYWRGNLLEEVTFKTKEGIAYLATVSDKNQGLKTTIVLKDGESGSLYNGLILKSGEDTVQIVVDSTVNAIMLQQGENSSTAKVLSEYTSAYAGGKCELAAVVKDEKLFLTVNGTALGAVELEELLVNHKEDNEITFGICSNNSKQGVVGFTQVTRLTGNEDEIEYSDSKMKLTDAKFMVAGLSDGIKADSINGKITANLAKDTGDNVLYFKTNNSTSSSVSWEITGTLEQLSTIYKGFVIQNSDRTKAVYYIMSDTGLTYRQEGAATGKAVSSGVRYVFAKANKLFTTGNPKNFKAVIRDDVFSLLVEDQLVWQLPLASTDPNFGGFDAGTSYRFGLYCKNPAGVTNGQAEWSNLTVKYGDAVGKYKFLVEAKNTDMSADTINGKVTANLTNAADNHIWFATDNASCSSQSWEITGTFKQLKTLLKGFTIQKWDKTKARFYTMHKGGVSLDASGGNVTNAGVRYVFANADYDELLTTNNIAKKFKAVIQDDVFSFLVEDKLVWQLPLTDVKYGGFETGTFYRFALRCNGQGGQAEWSDLTVKYGDAVGEYKFLVEAKNADMTVDTINGKVTADLTDGSVNHMWFATDNIGGKYAKSWEITGTFKQLAPLMKGFTIQSENGTTKYYTMYTGGVSLNEKWGSPVAGGWNIQPVDGTYVFGNADYDELSKNNITKNFKVVIQNDEFSFWVEDKLVWKLPLTDAKFGGFKAGTSYRFGLRCLDKGGQAEWSDLTVKYGK